MLDSTFASIACTMILRASAAARILQIAPLPLQTSCKIDPLALASMLLREQRRGAGGERGAWRDCCTNSCKDARALDEFDLGAICSMTRT